MASLRMHLGIVGDALDLICGLRATRGAPEDPGPGGSRRWPGEAVLLLLSQLCTLRTPGG